MSASFFRATRRAGLYRDLVLSETRALQHGQDNDRDIAGYVDGSPKSLAPDHASKPHFESLIDVMELILCRSPANRGASYRKVRPRQVSLPRLQRRGA
jgi:hypothetical protein